MMRNGSDRDSASLDAQVRTAAFAFLTEQTLAHGEVLPRSVLAQGFLFNGALVRLVGPQGIFKPTILEIPLSITTVPVVEGRDPPYADELGADGLFIYRYRGTDPQHADNVGLRRAHERGLPLIYFFGLVPGHYLPVWPVFIARDDPGALSFSVEIEARNIPWREELGGASLVGDGRRQYVTQLTWRRVHQEGFRQRVLRAYRERCAVCHLRHTELLDAAHILPDGHPKGEPVLPNGLALCKLHHSAFDAHFLGIRPDLLIDVRKDVLEERDGPMLLHGLQGFHGQAIQIPRHIELQPSQAFLAERYDLFKKAG